MKTDCFDALRLLPVYALFLPIWLLAGGRKLLGPGVPQGFRDRFQDTVLATFPGITVSFYQIAVLEGIAALIFAASLVRGEFRAGRERPLLHAGLWCSMLLFAMLAFGQRLSGDNDGAASLFFYFGATAAIALYVQSADRPRVETGA